MGVCISVLPAVVGATVQVADSVTHGRDNFIIPPIQILVRFKTDNELFSSAVTTSGTFCFASSSDTLLS